MRDALARAASGVRAADVAQVDEDGVPSLAHDPAELFDAPPQRAAVEAVQAAASCGVELRPLDGRHDQAVGVTLPLARGLTPRMGVS